VKITNTKAVVIQTKGRELIERPLSYFSEPGIYRLDFDDRHTYLAFNSPAAESERALLTTEQLKRAFATKMSGDSSALANGWRESAERSGSTWRYFLVAAFLLMIAELLLASRSGSGEGGSFL
jgi:hypothetical protein